MAPTKKREKDATLTASTNNSVGVNVGVTGATTGSGVNNGSVGGNTPCNANNGTVNNCHGGNNNNNNNNNNNQNAVEANKLNGHQQEQELFLQAFEKPTQIYRFLRNRHGTSPIFLNRTLSYMKDRMSRNNKKRGSFKVNSILNFVTQKSETVSNNFLNIIYNGLYDKSDSSEQCWHAGDVVNVESTLYKITKSKRKDSTSDFQEVLSNCSNVIYNPHDDIEEYNAINIPVQAMRPLGDQHTIYKLLFRIKITPKYMSSKANESVEQEETPSKRNKMSTRIYGCELIVFEKNIGCLPEGDYEVALQELNSQSIKSFSPKKRTWETLPDNYIPLSLKFDVFNQYPTLKFRLTWSANEVPVSIVANDLSKYGGFNGIAANAQTNGVDGGVTSNGRSRGGGGSGSGDTQINHNNNCIKSNNNTAIKAEKIQIVYNFLYSNNTRQQTEYTQEVICPWCGLDCLRLYALLKHLKLCHARFNFTYQPAGNGARIDVTINDAYDGSYAGSPYDLAGPSGCSFARTCGPVRRTTVTNLLVCRPRRQKTCLDEFLVLDEDDLSNQRPYITGHNRLYHHTETCLPVHPKELDIDSEGESDPLWLRQKTIQMIDEFSDVNEGEKELMKLWNLHVMKHGYVGDCQLPLACEMFLDANGDEIIRKNLYRNFILHMCSLFDYGLVSPDTVNKTVQKLQSMLSKYVEGQELMSKQREAQLKYWLAVGMHKEDEQKLKSPQKQANVSSAGDASSATQASTSNSSNSASFDGKSMMHPPMKRSATAVKRASIHAQNGGADKLSNGAGGSGNGNGNKPVAKKTVAQDNSGESSGRERRSENGMRRSSTLSTGATGGNAATEKEKGDGNRPERNSTGGGATTQAVKRKLLSRDTNSTTTQASKRSRSDSHAMALNSNNSNNNTHSGYSTNTRSSLQGNVGGGNNNSNNNSNSRQHETKNAQNNIMSTTTTTANNNSSTTGALTSTKRLVTRRQSIAGTAAGNSDTVQPHRSERIASTTTTTAGNSGSKANQNSSSTASSNTHALRTRLSVPLTKLDKR